MKTVSNFVYVCDKALQIHALITNKKDRLDNQQRIVYFRSRLKKKSATDDNAHDLHQCSL